MSLLFILMDNSRSLLKNGLCQNCFHTKWSLRQFSCIWHGFGFLHTIPVKKTLSIDIFSAIFRLIFYHQSESNVYNGRLKELQTYLNIHRRIPVHLRHRIKLYVDYKYNGHLFNEDAIMETINEQIRQEINMFSCKKLVVNVPLFKDMPLALINTIIFSLTKVLYMPGEVSLL